MAIAFDTGAAGGVNGASTLTFSHTCTGSNLVLFVGVSISNDASSVTGVTYVKGGNPTAMTQIDNQTATNAHTYLFYMIAPDTGAHNVVVSTGTSQIINAGSCSYTGASQITQPDAHNKAAGASLTLSVVNSNCWIVATSGAAIGLGVTYTSGSGFTLRTQVNTGGDLNGLEDSNGTVSTGNNTVAFSTSSGSPSTVIAASINPFNQYSRTPSDSIMNGASRTVTISRATTMLRSISDSIMNAVGRLVFMSTSKKINNSSLRPSIEVSTPINPKIT